MYKHRPRTRKRSHSTEHPKESLNSNQVPLTPTALFDSFKDPGSLDHIHDFRHTRVSLDDTTHNNKVSFTKLPHLTLENDSQQRQRTTDNGPTSPIFICIICHTWICISSSTYRHTCTCLDYATHHYHAKEPWTMSQKHECCGCGNHIEMCYYDAIVPITLLSELASTRALTLLPLDSTLKPTMVSTITTFQMYIRDLLRNTRRNINTNNRHFVERIGLDDFTRRLFDIIGFTFMDGFLLPPRDIDNSQLCMIHEELGASLARMISTTKQLVPILEVKDLPHAGAAILDGLLGRQSRTENVASIVDTKLDDLCARLGVTSSASDELILWSYQQLAIREQLGGLDLLETLRDIATIRNSDLLRSAWETGRINEGNTTDKGQLDQAYTYFGTHKYIDDESLIIAHGIKKQEYPRSGATHYKKLRMIGNSRCSEIISNYLDEQGYDAGQLGISPVGLTNVGNTCYLNSLLQYYFTLKPFRKTIMEMDDYVENEYSADWKGKTVDGIQISRNEVKRGKKFMALLQNVFIQLQYTSDRAIPPELDLVKMALSSEQPSLDNNQSTKNETHVNIDSGRGSNDTAAGQQPTSSEPDLVTTNYLDTSNETDQQQSSLHSATAQQANNAMMFGKQQDVTECMDNMAKLLEAALKSERTGNEKQAGNMVRELFYGQARQILSYKDDNTKKDVQNLMNVEFSRVIVDAAKAKTLYDGLDDYYFAEKVENFKGGQEATREVTVESFPPILQVHIQRVQFDRSTSETYKSNAFIQFDKTIYMDRYSASNLDSLASRREKVAMWKNEIAKCQQNVKNQSVKMNSATSTSVDLPLSWMLESAASILDGSSGINSTKLADAVDQLREKAKVTVNTSKENTLQATEYETKIKNVYNDLTEYAYQLHAVFMHQGQVNHGHYWLYVFDHKSNLWWKLNDSLVTKVKETEVFSDTGSQSNAYFLVYIKKDEMDSLVSVSRRDD